MTTRRLEERTEALWNHARAYAPRVHQLLPVKVEEVEALLGALDDDAIIARMRSEVLEGLGGRSGAAVLYEWYYAGKDSRHDETSGTLARECTVRGYSNTDLVKLGRALALERTQPVVRGTESVGGFSLDPVMGGWYDVLGPRFDDVDYGPIVNTPEHAPFNEAQDLFNELFRLRLFTYLGTACEGGGVRNVFAYTHERWPVLCLGDDT